MTSQHDSTEELVDRIMANSAAEVLARQARERWKIFVRHYWSAILLALAFPLACLTMLVASYFDPGSPANIWLFYILVGVGRVLWWGNGIPLPYATFFDETYVETYHVYNPLTGVTEIVTERDPKRVDLGKLLDNLALNMGFIIILKVLLVALWGPLDMIVQGGHLLHAAQEFQQNGRLSEYRSLRWKHTGIATVATAFVIAGITAFVLDRAMQKPYQRSDTEKAALLAACAPGNTYIGSWEGRPDAGELGLKIDTLAELDHHDGHNFKATLFDPMNPERSKKYQGRIYFLTAADPAIYLRPDGPGKQVPPAPDPKLYLDNEFSLTLSMNLQPDGSLYVPYEDIHLRLRLTVPK